MNMACVYHATLPTSAQFGKQCLERGAVVPRRLGSKAKKVAQQIMERTKDVWRSVSARPCESPDVVIVILRAIHRVAPTTLDVKGINSAIFTTPEILVNPLCPQ